MFVLFYICSKKACQRVISMLYFFYQMRKEDDVNGKTY